MTVLGPMVRRGAKVGGALLLLGSVQFTAAMAVATIAYPGYSLSRDYISDLGGSHSPLAWLFNDSIRLLGVLGILGTLLIGRAFASKSSRSLGLFFLLLASVGAFAVGTFPEGSPQLGGSVHAIASAATFLGSGLALMMLSTAMLRDTRWDGLRLYTALSGVVTLAAVVLFEREAYVGLGPGGMEHVIVAPILLWAVVSGVHLLRLPTYQPTFGSNLTPVEA